MKPIFYHILTLCLLSLSMTVHGQSFGEQFRKAFGEGDSIEAKSVISKWEKTTSDDPDLIVSKALYSGFLDHSIDVDSIIVVLEDVIKEHPKRFNLWLDLLTVTSIEEEYIGPKLIGEVVALRNEFLADSTGWKYGMGIIEPSYLNPVLSNILADIVGSVTTEISMEKAHELVGLIEAENLGSQYVADAKIELARCHATRKEYSEAIGLLKEVLDLPAHFDVSAALFNIALYYYYLDNTGEALKYAEKAEQAGDTTKAPRLIEDLKTPMQHARYYDFVFQLLPRILVGLDNGENSREFLMTPSRIVDSLKCDHVVVDRDLSGITAEIIPFASGEVIVWTMPAPNELTEPKYVAFVPGEGGYRYYTLEKTMDWDGTYSGTPYLLGGADYRRGDSRASHFSTRSMTDDSCTPTQFVKLIEAHLAR